MSEYGSYDTSELLKMYLGQRFYTDDRPSRYSGRSYHRDRDEGCCCCRCFRCGNIDIDIDID